jgi:integrase/recombinase XerC
MNRSHAATVTAYLKNSGTLEKAASMANLATRLYDRRTDEVLEEIENAEI